MQMAVLWSFSLSLDMETPPFSPEDIRPGADPSLARYLSEDGILCLQDLEASIDGLEALDLPANAAAEVTRCRAGLVSLQASFLALSDTLWFAM